MKLGIVSDSLRGMSLTDLLSHAQRMGASGVAVNTCSWFAALHFDLKGRLGNGAKRKAFRRQISARGLEVNSMTANGNPLHPTDSAQGEGLTDATRVAGKMGNRTACTLSGPPPGTSADTMPNWVVSSWPLETQAILRYQREDRLLPFLTEIVALAKSCGADRIALELHGNQCAYNVPSLLKLRAAVGSVVGANLDPNHLVRVGADPLVADGAPGDVLSHVHAKNAFLNAPKQATTSLLENGSLMGIPGRAWSSITLGFGHGEEWWRQFCYRLTMAGCGGWRSIEHADALRSSLEYLEKSVALLRGVIPFAPSDHAPQAI